MSAETDDLKRKIALYERTLGIAVAPVLMRRLVIVLARGLARAGGDTRREQMAAQEADSRVWAEAGPRGHDRFKMFIDPSSGGHAADEMADGSYEAPLLEALQPFSSLEGAVIWDVGAHIGYESLCFATLVGPTGHLVAFEPNPANVHEWHRNVAANPDLAPRMELQTVALSDTSGPATFRVSDDVSGGLSSGSHLAAVRPPEDPSKYASFESLDVECARVDDLVESSELAPPSVIKIDVEGAEASVLRGALRTIRRHQPILLVEMHRIQAMHEVDGILDDLGYAVSLLDSAEDSPSRCFLKAVAGQAR